jgi:putative membrane protein insertion efficiency factor
MRNKLPLKLINWYQTGISPNTTQKYRYIPTCNQYAKECYEKFNFVKASFLTTKRLLRCNPLFKGGYDPVPLTKEEKKQIELENEELLKKEQDNE